MFQSFSKKWIVFAVAVFVFAGIFCWQYFETQRETEIFEETKISENTISESKIGQEVEKLLKECNKITESNIVERERCNIILYTLAAAKEEEKMFCDKLDNACYKCHCCAIVDLLHRKNKADKMRIIGVKNTQLLDKSMMFGNFQRILINSEVESAISNNCQFVCSDLGSEADVIAELKEQEEIIKNEAADWKIYKKEEYGFEIKYPEEWATNNNEIKNSNSGSYLSINQLENKENFGLDEWFDKYTIVGDRPILLRSSDDIVISGLNAKIFRSELEPPNPVWHIHIADQNNRIFYLFAYAFTVKDRNVLNQMLSSFRSIGKKNKNAVADYFENAELQYETEAQKQEIFAALNDILNLSEEQLKQKRYKDYVGKENQWDLSTLIYRYFVPDKQGKFVGNNFYHDIKLEEARKQIEQILKKYF